MLDYKAEFTPEDFGYKPLSEKRKAQITKMFKFPFNTQQIGRMTAEELQNNIEKYAKRLNQRLTDIRRYTDDLNVDFTGIDIQIQRTLGGKVASRKKIEDVESGRYRLRRIKEVYEGIPKTTRTGLKLYYQRKQLDYSRLLGVKLTMTQTMRFAELTQGLTERVLDSDLVELLQNHDPVNDAFDGDVEAFMKWLIEKRNRGEELISAYSQLKNEKGL